MLFAGQSQGLSCGERGRVSDCVADRLIPRPSIRFNPQTRRRFVPALGGWRRMQAGAGRALELEAEHGISHRSRGICSAISFEQVKPKAPIG